jgi:transposase
MDETRWLVFAEVDGKIGHRWWLWVVVTSDTCAYLLDPSRSAAVPRTHLGEDPEGIISADRYGVYKSLGGKIRIAFCWAHVRRDFLRVGSEYGKLKAWADAWVERIGELYRLNDLRLSVPRKSKQFTLKDLALRQAIARMKAAYKKELRDPTLHPAARKTLVRLRRHWKGLTLFVDHPEIPMDNNEAERRLRNPVVGRKNYYGSGALWSGTLSAVLFTIIQTALLNGLNPQRYLQTYLEACARNGGRPPRDLEAFLPWNFSKKKKAALSYPKRPP